MNTGERNLQGRVIYRGRSGGRYVITASGRKQYLTATTPLPPSVATAVASPPVPTGFKKVTVAGQQWIVSRQGQIRKPNSTRILLGPRQVNKILTQVALQHPLHLNAEHVPYVSRWTHNAMAADPQFVRTNESVGSRRETGYAPLVFFHAGTGRFYYRTVTGVFHPANSNIVPQNIRMNARHTTQLREFFRLFHNRYPNTGAGAGNRGPRSNANMLANMNQQIFARGPINVTRYTANEKKRLATMLSRRMKKAKNRYKENKAAGKSANIYGQWANQAKAYFRGLRAVKPLTGNVKSPRIRNETPNRGTPAAKNTQNFVTYNNLETPHIVVKRTGTETFHINPNTLIGFIKAGSGANIKNTNLRNWLRQMRRNHPSESLFQHPASKNKTVRPKNIRFTR